MLSRVFASAAPARSLSSCATRRFRYLPLDRRSTLRNLLFAMSQQQGNGEAEQGDRRSTTSASTSTDTDIRTSKKALRSSISATLMALPDEEMARQSAEIAHFVLASPIWKSSKKVGIYLAAPRLREVGTELLVRAALGEENATAQSKNADGGASSSTSTLAGEEEKKKRLFVPIVGDGPQEMSLVHLDSLDGLRTVPPFGIREPSRDYGDGRPREDALTAHIDALFLPGVAFDREGRRLGRGLGYYDAWAHRARRAKKEAVAAAAEEEAESSGAKVEVEAEDASAGPLLVGLAFSQQMTATNSGSGVPVERHDVGLDAVAVAGEGLVATSERGRRALAL